MVDEGWLETNFNKEDEIESLIVDVDGYEGPLDVLLTCLLYTSPSPRDS